MKLIKKITVSFAGLLLAITPALPMVLVHAADGNLIANPSLETVGSGGDPQGWSRGVWGANTPGFEYSNEGHTGSRSVKATVSDFADGDAKWYFDPVAITGGNTYTFSDYYKSDIGTELVVRYLHQGGDFSYAWIGSVAPSSGWALVSESFIAPATATQVTVFHLISANGWLVFDDADLRANPATTPGSNLIANQSVEQASSNPNMPQAWASNSWGGNTASFTYPNEGHTGSRSVRTQITAYTGGDAKWYFNSVPVSAGTAYTFSDYYKSNVQTQLVVRYTSASGTDTYEWLGTAPDAASWQQATFGFTPPSGTATVSVFHIVTQVGWLVMDDASLATTSAPDPDPDPEPAPNPIANPSVETVSTNNPSRPAGWSTDRWGSNTTSFTYPNEGHTGSRSVKVTISNHSDGDAKWYFEPVELEPGGSYLLDAWYKTNATAHVVAMHQLANGNIDYQAMREPFPDGDAATVWQHYTGSFFVPANAESTTIYFFLSGNGWLQTDDFALSEYQPAGFSRPLVSLTFDDGFEDNVTTALPVLNQRGFKSTQCFATDHIEGNPVGIQAVQSFYASGHEICSHSASHPFMTQLTPEQLQYELEHPRSVLESIIGEPVTTFATPYGDYNYTVVQNIAEYYESHRTVDEGYNSIDNFDASRIVVQNMEVTTTLAEYQGWLDYAKTTNTWLVLVYHRIAPGSDASQFDTKLADFNAQMSALSGSGLTVKTYKAALAEVLPQVSQ